jgi:spore coat protein CotH
MIWKKSKTILAVFLLAIIITPNLSGCAASEEPHDRYAYPFDTSRVATVRIEMLDKDWEFCMTHPFEEQYVPADFWFDDELVTNVGVRTKGNSSLGQAVGWGSPRMPLAVDFNLLNRSRSFHGVKKVFLNNGWSDPTLIREILAYDIFASIGLPTPRATLIDLWVNDIHLGVYTMAEVIDTSFLRLHFDDASGNLYKPELAVARLNWTEKDAYKSLTMPGIPEQPRQDPALYTNIGGGPLIDILRALGKEKSVAIYEDITPLEGDLVHGLPPVIMPRNYLEAMALKTNENNPDYSGLFKFLDVLNNEPDETFPQEIEKVLDVDSTLKFIAASALVLHLDNYIGIGHNSYLYEVNGVFTPLVWDTNMAFGTFNQGIKKDDLINYYIDEPTAGPMKRYPLVNRLLNYEPYFNKYRGYIEELMDGAFSLDVILPRLEQLVELVRPYAKADTEMFYSYEDWERCITEDLRPPDIFEGWMAGGPSPMFPFSISPKESNALYRAFGVNNLWELYSYDIQESDIPILRECLTKENADSFLQNFFGPLMAPQPPRQPGFGPNSLGLKTFIIARYESVRQQLNGERPSGSGRGNGNGGSMWMADWFSF